MKNLVLITSNFPYGTGEPFIGTELSFLHSAFDKVIIISQNPSSEIQWEIPEDVSVYRYNPSTSFKGFILLPVLMVRNFMHLSEAWREEINFRKKIEFSLTIRHRLFLIRKIIKALQLRNFVRDVLEKERIGSDVILYSFWMNSGANAISLLNLRSSIKISRAQASDLYEEKSLLRFLPLLKYTADRLDAVFFPSKQSRTYYLNKTGSDDDHLRISRLGVSRKFSPANRPFDKNAPFVIVSCSNLIPLKRVDLIIRSLEHIKGDRKINWIHFGDGPLRHDLEKLAAEKLGNKETLSYNFRGYVPNLEVLRFYSVSKVDLFINTSSTEGTPVSIMEAQSYGIPVVATDVGAVAELVTEGTGSLLPVDFKPVDLAQMIEHFMEILPDEMDKMREGIIDHWEVFYNAEINYPDFISQVISIFDNSTGSSAVTR